MIPSKPIRKKAPLYILVIACSIIVAGCKRDPRVMFIQGLWYYKDAHLANIPGESAQETNWEFRNGYFSIYTCCFYKASYSGFYSITEREENKLTLEMFNLRGQAGDIIFDKYDTLGAVLKIDPEGDTLLINGDGPYTRIAP